MIFLFLKYLFRTFFLFFRYSAETDTVSPSTVPFKNADLKPIGKLIINVCSKLKLVKVTQGKDNSMEVTNFTILCLLLRILGPVREKTLVIVLLLIQVRKTVFSYIFYLSSKE